VCLTCITRQVRSELQQLVVVEETSSKTKRRARDRLLEVAMQIARYPYDSIEAKNLVAAGHPVVLVDGCKLAGATDWSFDRLSQLIPSSFECDVYASSTPRFKYWDDVKNKSGYPFVPPTQKLGMTFSQFAEPMDQQRYLYLQTSVVAEMGDKMLQDYSTKFSLEQALLYKVIGKWDAFTSNLLLCGKQGAITPLHFDEQQNLFAQLWGRKRVRLFPPDSFSGLYPYPMGHPHDRQAQVELPSTPGSTELEREEDRVKFPGFARLVGDKAEQFVDLGPGEVLFVPQYWWHQMESLEDNTSMSWWFRDTSKASRAVSVGEDGETVVDMELVNMVAVRRNVENLISSFLSSGREVHLFLLALAAGVLRLTETEDERPSDGNKDWSWEPLAVDAARAQDVLPHVQPEWPTLLSQALSMVQMLPWFSKDASAARAFLLELVRGRFSSLDPPHTQN